MKRILVTGAGGFIGSHIIGALKDRYDVIGTLHSGQEIPGKIVYDWTIDDEFNEDVNIIIHAAALNPAPGLSFMDYYIQNVKMAEHVVSYAHRCGAERIIYFAAVSSFGNIEGSLNECSLHHEPDDYGLSKWIAEKIILEGEIPSTTLILPGVVGNSCRQTWLTNTVHRLLRGEDVRFYNGDGIFNNVLLIDDLVNFVEMLIGKEGEEDERYLLGSRNEGITVHDMLVYMKDRFKSNSRLVEEESATKGFSLDISKALELGFEPTPLYSILDFICDDTMKKERREEF